MVRLSRPSNRLAGEVAAIPTLVGLYLGSDPFDASELAPLKSRLHLAAVIVRQRELSDAMLEELGGCRWLLQLNLAGTDLDGQKLRALDSLEGLRWVDLSGTPLRLADLGRPEWSRHVRRLKVSRPEAGRSDRLTLDQWPQLEELSVQRNPVRLNRQPLELELLRLPNLRTVYLNRVQKVSLRAEELPKLGQLTGVEDVDSLMAAVQVNGGIPSLPWFSNLVLKAVPRLGRLRCFARDLQQLTIRDCRSLESLRLSSFTLQADGFVRLEDVDPERCQSWIDELGRGSGPRTVSLAGLPMSNVDLSPLRNNPQIRRMVFSLSDVEFDQIRRAAGSGQFEELQLGGCQLDDDDLRWLLNVSPRLKRLQADLSGITELEIVAKSGITQFQTEPIAHADTVRLVDVPHLYTPIHLLDAPERIEVRNAPALRGLTVERPWPAAWSLSGVRRLRTFVAGGPEADDELFAALQDCRNLDRLTFAYASLSEESLAAIGRFTSAVRLGTPRLRADRRRDRTMASPESLATSQPRRHAYRGGDIGLAGDVGRAAASFDQPRGSRRARLSGVDHSHPAGVSPCRRFAGAVEIPPPVARRRPARRINAVDRPTR